MSFQNNFQKFSKPSPPERGAFPVDHGGACKSVAKAYMACLKTNKNLNAQCRDLSRAYLQCRMDRNLMAPDEMLNLGFQDEASDASIAATPKPDKPDKLGK